MAPTGLYHPPGGKQFIDKSILTYNICPKLLKNMCSRVRDAKRFGIPSFISKIFPCTKSLNKADRYFQSWFYWSYKDFGKNTTPLGKDI